MMVGKLGGQNVKLHSSAMNQNNLQKNQTKAEGKLEEDKSMAIISPGGKKQSMIQQLIKQKQSLTDRINSLSKSPEFGSESIQDQMKELQKQMDAIDTQILELQTQVEDRKKQDSKLATYEKPKTKEQAQQKKLSDLMNLATSSDQMDITISTKGQVDRRINILNSEIETGYGDIESKMEEVAKLESKSASLNSQLNQQMDTIMDKVENAQNESELDITSSDKTSDKDSVNMVESSDPSVLAENTLNEDSTLISETK